MAPQSAKRSSAKDDDFVFTLSDDENETRFEEEDDDNEMQGDNAPAADNKKRKREVEAVKPKNKKQKQLEKQQLKNAKKNKKNAEPAPAPESEEEEEEDDDAAADATEDDGVLNPEFEFDVGGIANRGVTEGFDGWGIDDNEKKRSGDKKAVDIDDIIERRQAKKDEAAAKKQKKKAAEKEESASASEDEAASGDEMPVDFEDDELMADDAFGMGADGEEESDAEGPEPGSGDEDEEDDEDKDDNEDSDDDAASDNDSVATPVGHPDDMGSDRESDVESEVDEEEAEKRKAFFAPEEKVDTKANMAKMTFQEFNLSRPILRGLAAVGFTDPTPIQRKAIPVALLGKDIVGSAVTGSGKTAAFIVPILERLLFRPRKVPTSRVVVLMPTRELAVQCYNVSVKLATFTDVTFCQLVGGFSLREQENVLKKRPDVIIATPGRFIDHMRNSPSFTVDTLEILVLDEADRMLEDGFADELNEILTTIPKSRQTMLFSATMTDSIDKLIRVGMNRPMRLMVDAKKNTVSTLIQEFAYSKRVIIFFRQKKEAHRVRIIFGLLGLKAAELHGSLSQEQRIKSVENFRDGKVAFLLATDVASRGLDIKGVETVINYEAPQSHEIYLHRVGRTARAGRSGRACTIAAEPDRKVVKLAVRAGKAQGAKIVSRVVEQAIADSWAQKAEDMADEVAEVLQEEKTEKQFSQAEMQFTKGENLMKHGNEIMSRPKRTWFETEKDKKVARKLGAVELNGPATKKSNVKLSNKDKKRLDDAQMRHDGNLGWKKGKGDAESAKDPKKGKGKGKGPGFKKGRK
ncbi:Helicase C-terminal [Penicillium expansum]|nr:Helicase C-terminal [Penicillium expansum]